MSHDEARFFHQIRQINRNSRLTMIFAGVSAAFTAVIAITLLVAYVKVIPPTQQAISDVRDMVPKVEKFIEDSTVTIESTNRLITDNEEKISEALEQINKVDFESLNHSIQNLESVINSLKTVVEKFPLSGLMTQSLFGGGQEQNLQEQTATAEPETAK